MTDSSSNKGPQTLVALGVLLTGLAMGWGALGISSDAGYGGVGPNFLPMLCAAALTLCGLLLLWEARSGGFRNTDGEGDLPAASGYVVSVAVPKSQAAQLAAASSSGLVALVKVGG